MTHYQGYLNQVDWTDHNQVARALRVFEASLAWVFDPATEFKPASDRIDRLRRLFARDGYTLTEEGKIEGAPNALPRRRRTPVGPDRSRRDTRASRSNHSSGPK